MNVDVDFGGELQSVENPSLPFENFLRGRIGCTRFTDSSKLQIEDIWRVRCASYSPEGNVDVLRSIDGRASIFTTESVALLDAVEMASRFSGEDILVFSDSLSALLSLKSRNCSICSNPYVLEVKEACYFFEEKSVRRLQVLFFWIPGHLGL